MADAGPHGVVLHLRRVHQDLWRRPDGMRHAYAFGMEPPASTERRQGLPEFPHELDGGLGMHLGWTHLTVREAHTHTH